MEGKHLGADTTELRPKMREAVWMVQTALKKDTGQVVYRRAGGPSKKLSWVHLCSHVRESQGLTVL